MMRATKIVGYIAAAVLATGACERRQQEQRDGTGALPSPREPTEGTPAQPPPVQQEQISVTTDMLFKTRDTELIGRQVSLDQPVSITRVINERVFFVRPAGQDTAQMREVMVVLERPGEPLQVGQTLTGIEGDVRRVQSAEVERWNVGDAHEDMITQQPMYVHAMRIEGGERQQGQGMQGQTPQPRPGQQNGKMNQQRQQGQQGQQR
jgi:hypothetical protein